MSTNSRAPRYSAWRLLREALRGQQDWTPAWEDRDPSPEYDVVIIGGGNTGRNTTIIRSNYFHPQSAALHDLSVSLYENLSRELNYNLMLSQRGMMELAHNRGEL